MYTPRVVGVTLASVTAPTLITRSVAEQPGSSLGDASAAEGLSRYQETTHHATHVTREFFQVKHRMIEFLAIQMGFTIFTIEANMPEAYIALRMSIANGII